MLQQDEPRDLVIATGESHSVEELVALAFEKVALDWKDHVEIDPRYFRPTDVDFLQGNPARAKETLGWEPKVGFAELVGMMIDSDLVLAQRELKLVEAGLA